MRKPGPNALARIDEHACDLRIVSEEMLDQVQTKIFQGLNGVLASQRVRSVRHSVGGENIAIVALHVRAFKVTFKAYRQFDLADVVATLLLGNAKQVNSRTPIVIFSEPDRHKLAPEANTIGEEILAQRRTP